MFKKTVNRTFFLVSFCFLGTLSAENRAMALIDPGAVALLSAITAYTAQTVSVLKTTANLLELGENAQKMFSDREDDADSLSELFEEISPTGTLNPSQKESYDTFKGYRDRLSQVGDTVGDVDSIKWNAKYLKTRMDRADPKRLASFVRTATSAIRLGKKIANLIPKSHEEQVAWNTEVMRGQNYAMGKALLDIRSEVRAANEREALSSVDGTIHTVAAIEQLESASDAINNPIEKPRRW